MFDLLDNGALGLGDFGCIGARAFWLSRADPCLYARYRPCITSFRSGLKDGAEDAKAVEEKDGETVEVEAKSKETDKSA